jgi:branched-subunit amino acid aminotransferase/4-amino-4-deoxychorismate lyase
VERVLAGITRASVIELARAHGLVVREAHLSAEELTGADEAFLTATSLPIMPIASIDGQTMALGAPGPVTSRLRAAFTASETGADDRFAHWLEIVR